MDIEDAKQIAEELNQLNLTKATCPNCGYCPHCGRGHQRTLPWHPYPWNPYPWSPYTPWVQPFWGGQTWDSTNGNDLTITAMS